MSPKRKRGRKKRIPYLVEALGILWQVQRAGRQIYVGDTRLEAHAMAVKAAKAEWRHGRTPTEVRLKNRRTGRFSKDMERTFGDDPFPPRG